MAMVKVRLPSTIPSPPRSRGMTDSPRNASYADLYDPDVEPPPARRRSRLDRLTGTYLPELFEAQATIAGGKARLYERDSEEAEECSELAKQGLVEMKRTSRCTGDDEIDLVAVRLSEAGFEALKARRSRDGWTFDETVGDFTSPCSYCGKVGTADSDCCQIELSF